MPLERSAQKGRVLTQSYTMCCKAVLQRAGVHCATNWQSLLLNGRDASFEHYAKKSAALREHMDHPTTEDGILSSTTTSTMSHFRILVSAPAHYDGSGGVDDWCRGLLSYLGLADPRYKSIGTYCLEYTRQPATCAQMAYFDCVVTPQREGVTDLRNKADYPSSVLFHGLVQMTKGQAYTVMRKNPDDKYEYCQVSLKIRERCFVTYWGLGVLPADEDYRGEVLRDWLKACGGSRDGRPREPHEKGRWHFSSRLGQPLASHTFDGYVKLKSAIRYHKGTDDYNLAIRDSAQTLGVITYAIPFGLRLPGNQPCMNMDGCMYGHPSLVSDIEPFR